MTTTIPQLFEPTPSISFCNPHDRVVAALVELNDDSFLSCSDDNTAKQWLRVTTTTTNNNLQLVGTYRGHDEAVLCGMKIDDTTLLTGSLDRTMKVWNTTTCECLRTLQMSSSVYCLLKTKDKARFLCGLYDGTVQMRLVSDLGVLSFSFKIVRQYLVFVSWKMSLLWVQHGRRWRDGMRKEQCFNLSLDTQTISTEWSKWTETSSWVHQTTKQWGCGMCPRENVFALWLFILMLCAWTRKGEGWCVCNWVCWRWKVSGVEWERRLHWDSPKQELDYSNDETERWIDCDRW